MLHPRLVLAAKNSICRAPTDQIKKIKKLRSRRSPASPPSCDTSPRCCFCAAALAMRRHGSASRRRGSGPGPLWPLQPRAAAGSRLHGSGPALRRPRTTVTCRRRGSGHTPLQIWPHITVDPHRRGPSLALLWPCTGAASQGREGRRGKWRWRCCSSVKGGEERGVEVAALQLKKGLGRRATVWEKGIRLKR